ncbi:hypothetical protein O1611_g5122 [Lasiodiplodia mahajangana]|uniref:Uncharacterized protein n=1 Tax=Lasiodiplodia mahajangana TaxID=1108764 RepID=A0ACC2JLX1_9PEZI|nr:hypothetical protein O1611_g5122 [Lasiodiplodia mahajangana]
MAPKTRRGGSDPRPDLPGLFPTHDGSYGINTLINIDTEPRKGHNSTTGIAQEQLDDKQWVKSMKGKVAKKYGMNSNLKKAIDASHREVEEEEHQGQNPQMAANPPNPPNPPNNDPSSPSSSSSSRPSRPSGSAGPPSSSNPSSGSRPPSGGPGGGGPARPPNNPGPMPPLAPHVPNYNPNNLFFPEDYDDRPRPPYQEVDVRSANPHAYVGVKQTITPPSENIPFYGMPRGEGSKEPISPSRPDSSRSFNYEGGLFNNATVQTPSRSRPLFPGFLGTAQGPTPPAQNQTAAPTGSTGMLGMGGQSTAGPPRSGPQPILGGMQMPGMQPNLQGQPVVQSNPRGQPGMQPHSQGQPTPGPSGSGPRPISGGGLTPGMQPNPQGQRTSAPTYPGPA